MLAENTGDGAEKKGKVFSTETTVFVNVLSDCYIFGT